MDTEAWLQTTPSSSDPVMGCSQFWALLEASIIQTDGAQHKYICTLIKYSWIIIKMAAVQYEKPPTFDVKIIAGKKVIIWDKGRYAKQRS